NGLIHAADQVRLTASATDQSKIHITSKAHSSARNRFTELRLILVGQPVEALLHLAHLALQIVDLLPTRCARRALLGFGRAALAFALGKRREHREGALEHLHVP